jgi:hypothetical protein
VFDASGAEAFEAKKNLIATLKAARHPKRVFS